MCYENGIPGVSKKPITIVGKYDALRLTILKVSLQLPMDKKCKVFGITGRVVESDKITHGIYFIEIDNGIVQKVVKVR